MARKKQPTEAANDEGKSTNGAPESPAVEPAARPATPLEKAQALKDLVEADPKALDHVNASFVKEVVGKGGKMHLNHGQLERLDILYKKHC